MSQMAKSGIYIAVALVAALVAYISRPEPAVFERDDLVGKAIFANFTDPSGAKSLRLVRYDEDMAELDTFEVRQVGGRWVLPSHSNYPADAENRIRDAASEFVGLQFVGVVPSKGADLSVYGVLEPNEENRQRAAKGVGTLLEMEDADGAKHQLIVGNPVQGQQNQHYVRPPQQNEVYIARIDMSKFPREFEEWINPNLLDINTWDIQEIVLKDYSFQILATPDGRVQPHYEQRLQVTVHEENGEWKLDELQEFRDGKLQPSELADGEALNNERLNGLRDALSDLTIVNVQRKPGGLKEDLTADTDIFQNAENVQSLMDKGFYPVQVGDNQTVDLLSSDGEILVRMKNGVEYVLRFGNIAGSEQSDEQEGEAKLNRYLFVSARVNKDLIPQPQLEPLPEGGQEPDASNNSTAADASESSGAEASDASDASESTDTSEATDAAEATDASASSEVTDASADSEASTTSDSSEPPAASDQSDASTATEPADASSESESTQQADEASESSNTSEDLEQERQRIVRDNQLKKDEYNEKLAAAETKKNELNYRFAEWYYVIPEDVFKKVRLNRADLIGVDPKAKGTGYGIGDLRELQQGIEGQETAPQPLP